MTTPAAADLKPARLRLWSNWLWILAAVLATAVLWSAVRLIHDQRLRREALRSLAQDKASEIANLGAARFNLLLGEALGPAWGPSGHRADLVERLVVAQREREACRCRETLPIVRFFRFDPSTRLQSQLVQGADSLADSTLARIAAPQWSAGMQQPAPLRSVEVAGSYAVLTVTRPTDSSGGTTVYGAVVPVSGLASSLFGAIPLVVPVNRATEVTARAVFVHGPLAVLHAAHVAEHQRLVQLDSLGLGIATDSQRIYGALADRPYMATATLPAPLQKFHVNVGLMGSQVTLPLLMPFALDRLWLNGLLVIATIVVCLFAIGSSRREVALARARSDFVAGVSHDLRMPLAQILLAGETLSLGRDRNEKERSALTGSILREARRLKAMIDNVLLFSRSGAVGIQPNLQAFEVGPLLSDVAQSVDLALADAGQTIQVEGGEEGVVADRALLHQAMVNLVDNAMKYGPRGQCIRLRTEPAGAVVRIMVEDQGPGIPHAARSRLFEAYERLARDTTSERTGSGLGLAVVRQIVLACNGQVRIEDVPHGSRIVVELPTA